SENRKAAEEVEKLVQEKAGEQAKGFKSHSFTGLAKAILADKGIYLLYASDDFIIKKAIQVLKGDAEFLEKSNLKYRHLIIEKIEKTNANQRQLIELLSAQHGEFMLNIDKKAFNQSQELREWIEGLEEMEIIESL
ncbi:MAG: hypothetical protein L0I93_07005, partial [Atopostipes suicloacalis]|nr:hypothetical protein [Atopostipes suicloacalis]